VIPAKLMSDSKVTVLPLIGALESQIEALKLQVAILRDIGSLGGFEISPDAAPARAVAPPAARKPPEPVRTAEPPRQGQQAGGSRIENAKALMVKVFHRLGWWDDMPWVSKEFFDAARGFGMPEGSIKTYFTTLKNEGYIIRIPDDPDMEPLKLWNLTPLGQESVPTPTS
jgi:hypothetical protein